MVSKLLPAVLMVDATRGRGGPGPPDRFAAAVAHDGRLARFPGGVDVRAGQGRGEPVITILLAKLSLAGPVASRATLRVMLPRIAVVTVDGDLVGGARDGVKGHQAGVAAGHVVVVGEHRQAGHRGAGVDAQEGVEIAAGGR